MNNLISTNDSNDKTSWKGFYNSALKSQKGFSVLEFFIFAAILVVLAILVVPNLNLFLGVDKKISAANIEAINVRTAAMAYEENTGKYPLNSDILWHDPPAPGDYVNQPHARYTFDVGNGRILDATTFKLDDAAANANSWTGIRWDYTSGSWVKQ